MAGTGVNDGESGFAAVGDLFGLPFDFSTKKIS
jgi:hypothetical protein